MVSTGDEITRSDNWNLRGIKKRRDRLLPVSEGSDYGRLIRVHATLGDHNHLEEFNAS
jgi:hypothetical protein